MRGVIAGVIGITLLTGCGAKDHFRAHEKIAQYHYKAYEMPMAVVECQNGTKTTIYRQNVENYDVPDQGYVKVTKEVAGVVKSPVGAVVATGLTVLPNANNSTNNVSGDMTTNKGPGTALHRNEKHEAFEYNIGVPNE